MFQYAQREPWRREAETQCLRSGAVKENAALVRIEPIEGPGICGAEFPLKVAALGDIGAIGFADEPIRPPGSIGSAPTGPRWPVAAPVVTGSAPPPLPPRAPTNVLSGPPLSLNPPGIEPQISPPDSFPPREPLRYGTPPAFPQASPDYSHVPARVPAQAEPLPALGPARPTRVAAATPVEIKPAATLACPIVSALDQWLASSVQPAARHWFGQPVVEIKQISAYSCRGMNGQMGARISEHAFGNALDIAAFVLADGRRITVKTGWQGSPEEQGFLRDVQGAACETFSTVLAPGSNRFHYDHIHVDLMRRASGRRICQPGAVDGEVIAARARRDGSQFASRREPSYAPRRAAAPIDPRNDPFAWRGGSRHADAMPTGSIRARSAAAKKPADDDDDWVEDDGPRAAVE